MRATRTHDRPEITKWKLFLHKNIIIYLLQIAYIYLSAINCHRHPNTIMATLLCRLIEDRQTGTLDSIRWTTSYEIYFKPTTFYKNPAFSSIHVFQFQTILGLAIDHKNTAVSSNNITATTLKLTNRVQQHFSNLHLHCHHHVLNTVNIISMHTAQ